MSSFEFHPLFWVLDEQPVREQPVREPPVCEPPVREPPGCEPPVREPPVCEPTVFVGIYKEWPHKSGIELFNRRGLPRNFM